jgi:hypothetical protein
MRGTDNTLWHKSLQWQFNGSTGSYMWSDWESLGGYLTAEPVVVTDSGLLHVFVLSGGNELYDRIFDGYQWSAWVDMSISGPSVPAVVKWRSGLDIFMRDASNVLRHRWYEYTTGNWSSSWIPLAVGLTSAPAAAGGVKGLNDEISAFFRGSDMALYRVGVNHDNHYDIVTTTERVGGNLVSAPTVVQRGDYLGKDVNKPCRIDVFARGVNSDVQHVFFGNPSNPWICDGQNYSWSAWESLGGPISSPPAAANYYDAAGRPFLEVYARLTDNNLWYKTYDYHVNKVSGSYYWSSWKSSGISIGLTPVVATSGYNTEDVFALDPNSALTHIGRPGGFGFPIEWLGGKATSLPAVIAWQQYFLN